MDCSCFKAASSNHPEEEEEDDDYEDALDYDAIPWLRFRIDGNGTSTEESSNGGCSGVSPTAVDDGNQSPGVENIPETVPRISRELWSLYKSLSKKKFRIQGLAFKVDSPELMQIYLTKLVEPEIPNDPRGSNRNTPIIYPAQFAERVFYITHRELPDTFTLKKRVEEKFCYEGVDLQVTIAAVNAINIGLDIYMRRLLEARYANVAPGRMVLPLSNVEHRRIAIWFNPSLITLMERMPCYDSMPRYVPERKRVPKPRVYVVDTSKKWQQYAERLFDRLRCQVLTADSVNEALQFMGLLDDIPWEEQVGKLDMICVEYHMDERNGLELLVKMKSSDRWKNTPFIMASSEKDDPPRLINQCLEEGADIFVAKPLLDHSDDIEELEYWLRRILY